MAFEDLFLNRGNMSCSTTDCSAKYPNVSKLHFWNSCTRGPYTTGAVHVSVTAVVEAQQTYGEEDTR